MVRKGTMKPQIFITELLGSVLAMVQLHLAFHRIGTFDSVVDFLTKYNFWLKVVIVEITKKY